jgi:putative multiple sugar transport system ATP-binding protein
VGLNESPDDARGQARRRQAAADRDRQGAGQGRPLLILDEPTAALQENDSQKLLDLMLELKAQGVTQIIISHKLNEISRVADRITVLRDGATVSTMTREEISEDRIIRDMVGRDMAHRYPDRAPRPGEVLMEVQDWSVWHPEQQDRQVIRRRLLPVRRRRDRGHRGADGRRAHRTGDEPLRAQLRARTSRAR